VDNTTLSVMAGATLTVEPGVVVKFYNDAGLYVLGKIIAKGTAAEPVVFTSFYDDQYCGDTNGDGTNSVAIPGHWPGVSLFNAGASGSVFENIIFRYAGKSYHGFGSGVSLNLENVSVEISGSVFEYGGGIGLRLNNVSAIISNNVFRYNNLNRGALGMDVIGSPGAVITGKQVYRQYNGHVPYEFRRSCGFQCFRK